MVAKKNGRKRGAMRSDRLRDLRAARKLTQEQLAEQTGISIAQIRRFESKKGTGRYDCKMSHADKLADVLDCSLDFLAGRSNDVHGNIRLEDLPIEQRRIIIAMRTFKDGAHKLQDVIAAIASSEEMMPEGD